MEHFDAKVALVDQNNLYKDFGLSPKHPLQHDYLMWILSNNIKKTLKDKQFSTD